MYRKRLLFGVGAALLFLGFSVLLFGFFYQSIGLWVFLFLAITLFVAGTVLGIVAKKNNLL